MKGSINAIETLGLLDGPGIRVVVFMNGCPLRCKFCHNPEMWKMGENNYTVDELVERLLRYQPYIKNNGGITFSGGEPLLQSKYLLEVCKKLKEHNIHIALDTSGTGHYDHNLLDYIDLVIYDIKAIDKDKYQDLVNYDIRESLAFLEECQKRNKDLWLRQVIVPGINDTNEYILELKEYIKNIKNVKKVELLPYHNMAISKYEKLKVPYVLKDTAPMDKKRCKELEDLLLK